MGNAGARDKYEAVIGLEVHAQLLTQSKMFCPCPNKFGAQPNANTCPVCTGQPGSLPIINRHAIELGVRTALSMHCEIHEESIFARKNYFYPDLPKNYQISQYEKPFATKGHLEAWLKNGDKIHVRIHRIHFEEDAGKSIHEPFGTLINLNRAGVPLVEIVSEPDMRNAEEAGQYLRTLRTLLRYLEVCDGNMEQGNFRCDANISVRPKGQSEFGTRVELKNINSFRFVEKAIEYEIERQVDLIEQGEKITLQTRLWNSARNITELMRDKEGAHDYRYFPEPDLPPLVIFLEWQEQIRKKMPELPEEKRARFKSQYSLSDYDAAGLTSSRELANYFEDVVKATQNPKAAANWVMNELLGRLNAAGKEVEETPVSPSRLATLILKIQNSEISGKIAKSVLDEMVDTGKSPEAIIKEKGLVQISDTAQLEAVIQNVLKENPEQLADYKKGKAKLLGYFVGQVMKKTKGQANPSLVNDLVKKALS